MRPKTNRRDFLKTSALATLGASAAGRLAWAAGRDALGAPDAAAPAPSPSERVNVAIIGVHNRGRENLNELVRETKEQNIVALCDVDETFLGETAKLYPSAKTYADWRRMLEQKDVDAVLVATPDHSHAAATVAALQLGKHVYCEKPLTYSVHEAQKVMQAAANVKTATQMGTQIHAGENYRRVVELVRAGAIGPIRRVHVWVGGAQVGKLPIKAEPVPKNVDYDLWLGPAPARPYYSNYLPFTWRGWWHFGNGELGDMACHHMDLPHWALGLTYPTSVEAEGPAVDAEVCPAWLKVNYQYAATAERPGVHLTWYHGDKRPDEMAQGKIPKRGAGTLYVGERGMLVADYGRHQLLPEADFKDFVPPAKSIPKSIGHHAEWIRAAKDGGATTCNFAYAGALTQTVLLGNVAYRLGKKLEWDPAALKVTNVDASHLITREYRKGWEM
jgi:predicted dehydrogenase